MSVPVALRGGKSAQLPFGPTNLFEMFVGVQVPDPITFVIGPTWLNRPNIYPRQATLLKIIFLRDDLMTDYDHEVIREWEENFRTTGKNGIAPGVLWRIQWLKRRGAKWFREVLLVMGRRAGKGHVTALSQAYVIWNYLAKGDPQQYYGVDRDKRLSCLVFAGKRDQAKATVFGDLTNVITSSECFAPYISTIQTERLSIYAPHDFQRMRKMEKRGLKTNKDMATFEVLPKESTPMAGRGPTSFSLCLDPSTPVLKSDLTWVPIGDIVPGDRVIGFDETAEKGKQRRLRDAEVQAVWRTRKPGLRLTFDDGSSVVCSPDHRWLSRELGSSGVHKWREARSFKVGSRIRHLRDPWYSERSWEEGYLAGVFDGEGCISSWSDTAEQGARKGAVLTFRQNPGVVADEVSRLIGEMGLSYLDYSKSTERRCRQWWLGGMTDAMEFMGRVRPHRLMAKQKLLWEGCAPRGGQTPHGRIKQASYKTIVAIEELPEQEMVDITTSTRTFFANGLFSHNCFDEMAHITASGTARSADEVYDASKPSTDQFGDDAFLVEPSSPWQMMGKFYENYLTAISLDDDGLPARPNYFMVQLASWDIYKDWERAHEISVFPPGYEGDLGEYRHLVEAGETLTFKPLRKAIQTFDDEMEREKAANPETFAVEREAQWATALDAYLSEAKVDAIFEPWLERPEQYGPPQIVEQQRGIMALSYKGHADPSKVNDKFGYAIAHEEIDAQGRSHVVFDKIGHFDPVDFPDNIIDYEYVDDFIWDNIITKFYPDEFTFDQYNSTSSIQKLQKKVRGASLPKHVNVFEQTTTRQGDWVEKENAKAAINLGFVHAPLNERARDELKFLQLVNGRVDHPSAGPVQSKDIADCHDDQTEVLTECGWMLFKDVPDGVRLATRNEAGEIEYHLPTARVASHYAGPMVAYHGRQVDFVVTPNHRMLVRPIGGKKGLGIRPASDLLKSPGQVWKATRSTKTPERLSGAMVSFGGGTQIIVGAGSGRGGSRVGRGWSPEEDDVLRDLYPISPMDELARALPGRTRGAIYRRAHGLGIKRGQIGDRHLDRPGGLPPVRRDLFAKFLGFWIAEGRKYHSGSHRGYGVKVTQTKQVGVEWFDSLLEEMKWPAARLVQQNGETTWSIPSQGLREYLRALCVGGHELCIPDEVFTDWSQEEMQALLEGLCMGDGSWSEQEQAFTKYDSSSHMLISDVQRLLVHIGMVGTIRRGVRAGDLLSGACEGYRAKHDMWSIHFARSTEPVIRGSQVEVEDYDGMVYCFSVPNATLLTRRAGRPLWSGNCMTSIINTLIGEQTRNFLHRDLNDLTPGATSMGEPFPQMSRQDMSTVDREVTAAMSGFSRARGNMAGDTNRARRRRY